MMKMHMNSCRGGACVRGVVLCLLAVFCLSLVAVPIKAGPPRPPGPPFSVTQRDTDGDPWIVDHRASSASKNDESSPRTRQISHLVAYLSDWALGIMLEITGSPETYSTVEREARSDDSRR